MEVKSYDLAIIGGGLAGTAAGWTAARRGLRTVIVERGEYPRDKVCGEFISAEALPLLRAMIPETAARGLALTRTIWEARSGGRSGFRLPEAALGLSRLALDGALWAAAGDAGCELRLRTAAVRVEAVSGGYRIQTRDEMFGARRLIVAAGRWWSLPGLREAGAVGPWVGVKARLRGLSARDTMEMFVFPGGYCGVSAVEDGMTNACCLVHRDVTGGDLGSSRDFVKWINGVARHSGLARRLEGGEQATETVVTAPVGLGPRGAEAAGARMAGDASGFIDPFAGDGMARALLSGVLAVESDHYADALRRAGANGFGVTAAMRGLVRAPGWAQALAVRGLGNRLMGPRVLQATRWRGKIHLDVI